MKQYLSSDLPEQISLLQSQFADVYNLPVHCCMMHLHFKRVKIQIILLK